MNANSDRIAGLHATIEAMSVTLVIESHGGSTEALAAKTLGSELADVVFNKV
jgi:hypothetical protein